MTQTQTLNDIARNLRNSRLNCLAFLTQKKLLVGLTEAEEAERSNLEQVLYPRR